MSLLWRVEGEEYIEEHFLNMSTGRLDAIGHVTTLRDASGVAGGGYSTTLGFWFQVTWSAALSVIKAFHNLQLNFINNDMAKWGQATVAHFNLSFGCDILIRWEITRY